MLHQKFSGLQRKGRNYPAVRDGIRGPQTFLSGFRNSAGSVFSSGGNGVLVGIVGLILFTVALWVTYRFLVTSLVARWWRGPTTPGLSAHRGPEKLPKPGREMALSFWCYIEELGPTDTPSRSL